MLPDKEKICAHTAFSLINVGGFSVEVYQVLFVPQELKFNKARSLADNEF